MEDLKPLAIRPGRKTRWATQGSDEEFSGRETDRGSARRQDAGGRVRQCQEQPRQSPWLRSLTVGVSTISVTAEEAAGFLECKLNSWNPKMGSL